jgi:hypothetical protein
MVAGLADHALYLRALGAKVGDDAIIGEFESARSISDLRRRRDDRPKTSSPMRASIGADFIIGSIVHRRGRLCRHVLRDRGRRGHRRRSAELKDLTSLPPGARIGAREIWDGSPARKTGMVDLAAARAERRPRCAQGAQTLCLYTRLCVTYAADHPPLGLLPIFPAFWVFDRVDEWLGIAAFRSTCSIWRDSDDRLADGFRLVLITVAVHRRHPLGGAAARARGDLFDLFVVLRAQMGGGAGDEVTLETLSSLFATIYMRAWYRMMGAKIGKDAEISTNLAGRYDSSRSARNVSSPTRWCSATRTLPRLDASQKVRPATRVFVGNDGVVPPGADIPAAR